jgi:hypothetical protein
MNSEIKTKGTVERIIKYSDGKIEKTLIENTVLLTGQKALAASLANQYGDHYDFFVSRMIFGNGGTNGGVPRFVPIYQNQLFGSLLGSKSVIAVIDPNIHTQVIFTAVLDYEDCNGTINEMALQMNNDDLYSMTTFPDLNKENNMQITWNWRVNFI